MIAGDPKQSATGQQQQQNQSKADENVATAVMIVKVDKPLEIGDHCMVKLRGGPDTLRARIVERRPLHYHKQLDKSTKLAETTKTPKSSKKRKSSSTNNTLYDVPDDAKPEDLEYYVHYVNHDRRLDQWVPLSEFILSTLERASDTIAVEGNG
ncbi:MAG: hypothetical protein SGARI_006844, partial [Bacillariaceae sp.]